MGSLGFRVSLGFQGLEFRTLYPKGPKGPAIGDPDTDSITGFWSTILEYFFLDLFLKGIVIE